MTSRIYTQSQAEVERRGTQHDVRCGHCGIRQVCPSTCPAESIDNPEMHELVVPGVNDDAAWIEIVWRHEWWCEWVLTRDGRIDRFTRDAEDCYQALVEAGLAEPFKFKDREWWNGCFDGRNIYKLIDRVEDLALEGEEVIRAKGELGVRTAVQALELFLYISFMFGPWDPRSSDTDKHDKAIVAAWPLRARLNPNLDPRRLIIKGCNLFWIP